MYSSRPDTFNDRIISCIGFSFTQTSPYTVDKMYTAAHINTYGGNAVLDLFYSMYGSTPDASISSSVFDSMSIRDYVSRLF